MIKLFSNGKMKNFFNTNAHLTRNMKQKIVKYFSVKNTVVVVLHRTFYSTSTINAINFDEKTLPCKVALYHTF